MELNPDFQEFLRSFVEHDVRFLIVGGYALAAHGHPRYTKDLDVWIWTDPSNTERIDILTFASGLSFESAFEHRVLIDVGDLSVPFISVDDLRTNKLATGRLRDRADAEDLPPVGD